VKDNATKILEMFNGMSEEQISDIMNKLSSITKNDETTTKHNKFVYEGKHDDLPVEFRPKKHLPEGTNIEVVKLIIAKLEKDYPILRDPMYTKSLIDEFSSMMNDKGQLL
jgi:hypothetical protein